MNAPTRTIAITGSSGRIATLVRPLLIADGFEIRGLDLHPPARLQDGEDFVRANLADSDGLKKAFRGVDLVLHLAGLSSEDAWDRIIDINLNGTHNVLEAARLTGVKRVMLASTNHVAGMLTTEQASSGVMEPAPDSYYGVSRAATEALAALYSHRYRMSTLSVRIGTVLPYPDSPRSLATWLSPSDFVRIVRAAIDIPQGEAHIIWGISRNSRRYFPLERGERIGYFPIDDAEDFASSVSTSVSSDLVGGAINDDQFPVGERWTWSTSAPSAGEELPKAP